MASGPGEVRCESGWVRWWLKLCVLKGAGWSSEKLVGSVSMAGQTMGGSRHESSGTGWRISMDVYSPGDFPDQMDRVSYGEFLHVDNKNIQELWFMKRWWEAFIERKRFDPTHTHQNMIGALSTTQWVRSINGCWLNFNGRSIIVNQAQIKEHDQPFTS